MMLEPSITSGKPPSAMRVLAASTRPMRSSLFCFLDKNLPNLWQEMKNKYYPNIIAKAGNMFLGLSVNPKAI